MFALAALAAVTAASAQSTVTISGNMFLGVGATEFGTASSDLQIVRQTGNIQFAGTEDLGGGLKAGFQLQTAIGAAAVSNFDTAQTESRTLLGDRYANLTLSGGFGTVLVGKANTGVKTLMGVADVTGLPINTGVDASSSAAAAAAKGSLVYSTGGDENARIIYGSTYANQVGWQAPTMNGFTVAVGIVPSQSVTTGVGDDGTTKDAVSYAATYANGPLTATVNYLDSATGTAYKMTTVAASYDLGVAKIAVAQQGIRLATGTNPGNGILVTANVPMGSGAFGLAYGRRTASAQTGVTFGDDVKQTTFGYKYNLSKRTSLSAVYNQLDRNGTATDIKETHIFVGHSF